MKIAVYAIALNEVENVTDWYENVKDADGIFVLDTGSRDGTVDALRELGVTVHQMHTGKTFRFDHARNEAASLIPADEYDVCVSLDFDERFESHWRSAIESEFTEEMTAANYTLVYEHDAQGNILCSYPRMAIHRPKRAAWQYPIHELLVPDVSGQHPTISFMCVHYGERKEAGHYLDLLKLAYSENPNDARCVQYLAREYFGMGNYQMAEPLYKTHVDIEEVAPFRAESCRRIAYMNRDDFKTAEWWYRHAIQHCDNIRESYGHLALYYFQHKKYEHCIAYVKSLLGIERPDYDMIYEDYFYQDSWGHHMLMACYQQLNFLRPAAQHRDILLGMFGQNLSPELARDIAILEKTIQEARHVYLDSMGV